MAYIKIYWFSLFIAFIYNNLHARMLYIYYIYIVIITYLFYYLFID